MRPATFGWVSTGYYLSQAKIDGPRAASLANAACDRCNAHFIHFTPTLNGTARPDVSGARPIAESSTMSSANPPSSEQPDATPAQVSASADDAAADDDSAPEPGASGDEETGAAPQQ